MYFASRMQAGRMLAAQLAPKYRYENCAVVALNDGAVMVGAQIAKQLHCVLPMLLSAPIKLPREPDAIAGISSEGNFSYSSGLSAGEVDEMVSEYRGTIEEQKLTRLHEMNRLLGSGGLITRDLLRHHNVIIVSDGLRGGLELDLVAEFLKPLTIERLIVATPLADVAAIDRIHVMADEVHCLSVIEDTFELAHYYYKNDLPDHQTVIKTIENIVLQWQ